MKATRESRRQDNISASKVMTLMWLAGWSRVQIAEHFSITTEGVRGAVMRTSRKYINARTMGELKNRANEFWQSVGANHEKN